jgi:hypothetical protein
MENGTEIRTDTPVPTHAIGADGPLREPRRARLLACDIRLANGRVIKARVRNISSGGMGGRADTAIDPRQRVEIMLPGIGVIVGQIAWIRQPLFGVQFDAPIDPGAVAVAAALPHADFVVPSRYQPSTDFRRPGLKGR